MLILKDDDDGYMVTIHNMNVCVVCLSVCV